MKVQTINTGYEITTETESKLSFEMFVLMGLILVYIGRSQEIFAFLTPFHMGIVFQVLAIPIILKFSKEQQFRNLYVNSPEMRLILALFCYGVVAALFSHYLRASITFMFNSFSRNVFLFVVVATVIKTAADLRRAVWCYIFSIFLLAVPSLFSHVTSRWNSLDSSYDANDLALLIVTTIPFVFYLIPRSKGIWRILLFLSVPIFLNALAATGSRGGFLGFVVVMAITLFKSRLNLFKKIGVVAIFLFAFVYLAPQSFHERISTIGTEDYNQSDNFGRVNIWKRSLEMIAANPVFGVGPGCFATANGFEYAKEIGGKAWDMTTHNSFLLVTVEMGIVGGILFLAFLYRNLMETHRLQRMASTYNLEEQIAFARTLETVIIGFFVSGFFLSFCYQPLPFFLVGLGVAYHGQLKALMKNDEKNSGETL